VTLRRSTNIKRDQFYLDKWCWHFEKKK